MPLYHCLHTNPFADMPIELTATRPISISFNPPEFPVRTIQADSKEKNQC